MTSSRRSTLTSADDPTIPKDASHLADFPEVEDEMEEAIAQSSLEDLFAVSEILERDAWIGPFFGEVRERIRAAVRERIGWPESEWQIAVDE